MHKHYWIKSDGTVMCNETGTNLPIGKPIECFPRRESTYLQKKLKAKIYQINMQEIIDKTFIPDLYKINKKEK